MAQNQLPPQAYTAEIIARAYEWLKSQPVSVQEMAKSADTLVALYMKAKRANLAGKERQSTESFQSDLKNLSEKMKNFGDFSEIEKRVESQVNDHLGISQSRQEPVAVRPQFANSASLQNTAYQSNASLPTPPQTPMAAQPTPQVVAQPAAPIVPQNAQQTASPAAVAQSGRSLDLRTQQILVTVQNAFNLSSPDEALRLLVQVGYSKIRDQLPQ